MKKALMTFVVLVMMTMIVLASGQPEISGNETTKLVIAGEAGSPQFMYFKSIGPDYTAETGVELEFIELPHDNMHERFVQESISRSGSIDIFNADQPWISEFASRGWIECLDDMISEEDRADFLDSAMEASSYQGRLYAIPYFIHTPIVFYRTDLFEEAGLTVPETWEEYRQAAIKLTNVETGVYGTIIEAKQASEPVTHLVDWYFQNGADFIDEKGNVVVDSEAAKEVFDFLLTMMYEDGSVMPGSIGYDNADVHNLFMQGKVAMVKNWPYMYAMARDPAQSLVADDFAIARQPAGKYDATAVWTWGFAISSSSRNKEAAWEFMKFVAGSDVAAYITPLGMPSFRNSVWTDERVESAMTPDMVQAYADTYAITTNNEFGLPRMTAVTEARDIMGGAVVYSIETKGQGPELKDMMEEAAAEVDELLKAYDEYGENYNW